MSIKGPTVKRILKEAAELSSNPSPDYHAAPLESDLYQWHFTLRGPPPPSAFAGGIYHGQITLPPSYPLKPPNFRFLTPSGRFEANREICLSISGHHEESWQPAWGIRTALVAIRSFMDTDPKGQVGGMSAPDNVRRRFALESRGLRCAACGGKSNEEIIKEQEEACEGEEEGERMERERKEELLASEVVSAAPAPAAAAAAEEEKKEEGASADVAGQVADETASGLDHIAPTPVASAAAASTHARSQTIASSSSSSSPRQRQHAQISSPQQPDQHRQRQASPPVMVSRDVWVDRAIVALFCALVFMVLKRIY